MLRFSSSLVAQLPFFSSCVGSQSGLAVLIPTTRTPSAVLKLLRVIDSADCADFVSDGWWWCCKHRGSCCSYSYASASPRNWSATLQSAGPSSSRIPGCGTANWIHRNAEDLAVLFCRGRHTGRLLPQRKGDLSKPELWSFHHWFPRGLSGIHRGGIAFGVTEKMTSVASRAGGRQLRERKGTHISLSTPAIGRKKGVARETTSTDDEMELRRGIEESAAAQEFEARLWDLDKSNKLTTLTVLELRGYMKLMSKPTAGRKDELISTVKEWLSNREISTSAKAKQAQAIQETSSDAESLEGALLKAENKNREAEAEATSRRTDIIPATKVNKKQKDAGVPTTVLEPEVEESTAPKRKAGDTATSTKKKISKNSKELDGSPDEEIAAKVVTKRKNHSSIVAKSSDVGTVVVGEDEGKRRKLEQIANVQEETTIKIVEEKVVEINVDPKKPWLTLAHKKPKSDWVVYDPQTIRPPALPCSVKSVKLLSWNVNGLRALCKGPDKKSQECSLLTQLAEEEDFDVLCLQETKLQDKDVEQLSSSLLPNYPNKFWSCSTTKLGYSGTAIISRVKPLFVKYGMGMPDHDNEGRLITAEFDNFYLVTSYVPNSGAELVRLSYRTEEWDPALSQYLKELEKNKPVIYTGDLNCANEEIDISNPDGNRKSAGFTNEERGSFKTNFLNKVLLDTFRQQHPNGLGYTYWGYRSGARAKNNGWRLDYFMVSEGLMNQIHDSYIRPDVMGSDHCPIGLIVKA